MSFFRRDDVMAPELISSAEFSSQLLDCIPGTESQEHALFSRAVQEKMQRSVRFWRADFSGALPKVGDRITVEEAVYRVLETRRRLDFLICALGGEYER